MWIIPCEEWKDGWHREHNMRICSQFTIQVSVLYEYICVTTGTQDSQMWFTVDSGESPVHPGVVCVQIYFSMPLITIYLITTPTCDSLELGCMFWYDFSETFLGMAFVNIFLLKRHLDEVLQIMKHFAKTFVPCCISSLTCTLWKTLVFVIIAILFALFHQFSSIIGNVMPMMIWTLEI